MKSQGRLAQAIKVLKLDIPLVTLPLECIVAFLAYIDQLISDVLLSAGRPTPSQCAAFELTSRLDHAKTQMTSLGKAMDEAKNQIAKLVAERDQLSNQLKKVCHWQWRRCLVCTAIGGF